MSAQIISGNQISKKIRQELAAQIVELKAKHNLTPGLAVVLVGENPASQVYVNMKEKGCTEVGIYSEKHLLPKDATQSQLMDLIDKLNNDPKIHGILVQLPLPKQLDEKEVLNAISPAKDVDGFHPYNVGKLLVGEPTFVACTPFGVIKMLEYSGIEIKGKRAVVVGRSNIVGKPVALLLLQKDATVTVCHSRTKDLAAETRRAEILIAAIGKPKFITADMVSEGTVVIDVGVNRLDDGSLAGDVDFEAVKEKAAAISPVPGGVGPMTIAMLLSNTVQAAKDSQGI
ncbi:MAG: bifunctional methylenetetrahydrofolate dehydrogenase/methenyltetrahydrofolate cyclohydrolase FolD [Candidatus Schekmanbacteria bacterium]|nr:bifunctional methylenetetrahydrofolate dehydrogenase/methenyltetrahydrofolate cyclohydrolase FolD [Candidatus Schekmanbacteria bacterium]